MRVTPSMVGVAPTAVALAAHLAVTDVPALLRWEKAVIFEGFDVSPPELGVVLDAAMPSRMPYVPGHLRRARVGPGLYTAPIWPTGRTIPPHQVLCDSARWPAWLLLYCRAEIGSTAVIQVVDAEEWLRGLDPEVRAAFAMGVRYDRHCPAWRSVFETSDQGSVERLLVAGGARWEWRADGLRVWEHRAATTHHPATGAHVWFHQPYIWRPGEVAFADGTAIPDDYLRHIRRAAHAIDVAWQAGDLLLVDNVLVAHGWPIRSGRGRAIVAMSA